MEKPMKFVNSSLFATFVLLTVVQFGCLTGSVMDSAEKLFIVTIRIKETFFCIL